MELLTHKREGLVADVLARVEVAGDCWLWQGAQQNGYGQKTVLTHRLMFELMVGPIPAGFVLDHVECDEPLCCNPAHVQVSTVGDNTRRSLPPTCQRKHPRLGPGECPICRAERQRGYRAA